MNSSILKYINMAWRICKEKKQTKMQMKMQITIDSTVIMLYI